jgi:hypothetical protein
MYIKGLSLLRIRKKNNLRRSDFLETFVMLIRGFAVGNYVNFSAFRNLRRYAFLISAWIIIIFWLA